MLKTAGGSFLSSHDPRVIMGTAKTQIDWIEVQWPGPSKSLDRIEKPGMNQYITIREGQGSR